MNKDLDKVKKVELEILDYFVEICQKNNLTYYLFWGTLLGAVRHSGFIPWDDDIDVIMPADDYIKFLNLMENEKNKNYYVQNIYNTKYCIFPFTKIRKYHTTMVERDLNYLPFKKGFNIDIFPLYKYPNSKVGKFLFQYRYRLIFLLLNRDVKSKNIKGKIIYYFLHLLPRSVVNRIIIKKVEKLLNYNGDFDEYRVYQDKGFDKKWFDKTEMNFENKKFIVPKDYDKILRKLYGDYMTPPPENKRYGHGEGNLIISFTKDYDEL